MKIILITLVLLSLQAYQCFAEQSNNIQYHKPDERYLLPDQSITAHELFSFVGLQSGLEIRFSSALAQEELLLPKSMSEQDLLRWLAKNLSTVQGFNQQGELISLVILPKGQFQSNQLIFANDPTIEGKAHQLGQTNITAKQRFQLRVNELNQVQQNQLNQRIEKDLKREIQATSREQQRQARQSLIESSLVTQLKSLRDTDSELYDRLLGVNIKRFPDLAAKVMDQASLPAE